MQRFTDLKVWQRSHALVLQIYRLITSKAAEPMRTELDEIARMLNGLRSKVERSG